MTAAKEGKTSNETTMGVQAAALVVIDTKTLPTTIASGGTIDFAAVVSGGTGDGFNYTVEAGSPAGGSFTGAVFTAGATAGIYTIKVEDKTSLASTTYSVKEKFTITPTKWSFLTTDATNILTIAGATATGANGYTWTSWIRHGTTP